MAQEGVCPSSPDTELAREDVNGIISLSRNIENVSSEDLLRHLKEVQGLKESLLRFELDAIQECQKRNIGQKNCYDCRACMYEEYGVAGRCTNDIPDPPVFEDLGARYHEWEEPAGAFPSMANHCKQFIFGERQLLAKRVLAAKQAYLEILAHLYDYDQAGPPRE